MLHDIYLIWLISLDNFVTFFKPIHRQQQTFTFFHSQWVMKIIRSGAQNEPEDIEYLWVCMNPPKTANYKISVTVVLLAPDIEQKSI